MISLSTQRLFKASSAPQRKRVACQSVYIRKNTFVGSSPPQISLAKMTFLCGSHHKKVVYHFDRKSTKNTFCPLQPLPYKALFARRQLDLPHISPFFFTSNTLHQEVFSAKQLIMPFFFRIKGCERSRGSKRLSVAQSALVRNCGPVDSPTISGASGS